MAAAVEPELLLVVEELAAAELLRVVLVLVVMLLVVDLEVAELPLVLPQLQELLVEADQVVV